MNTSNTHLINTPNGKIEIDAYWQDQNPNNPNVNTVAVICHPNPLQGGAMTNKVVTTLFRVARDAGYHVIRFNFRGVGQSTGEHDYGKGEVEDTLAVIQWLEDSARFENLWLAGFSFGGYVAARAAEQIINYPHIWDIQSELAKLVLIAPSVVKNATEDLVIDADKTLQFHGEEDEVVCPDAMTKFAHDKNITLITIPQTGHFFHGKLSTLKKEIEKYL